MKIPYLPVLLGLACAAPAFGQCLTLPVGSPLGTHSTSDNELVVAAQSTRVIDMTTTPSVSTLADLAVTPGTGNGVFVEESWIVVFRYSSVTVETGGTVEFLPHPSGAPVAWIVDGNVLIASGAQLDLSGSCGSPTATAPGPGGFAGGQRACAGTTGPGFGPGGGAGGGQGASQYTDPELFFLLGGSGSVGFTPTFGHSGGGSILIVACGNVQIDGTLDLQGGACGNARGGCGSARIVATEITGSGVVDAQQGPALEHGRVRFDYITSASLCAQPAPFESQFTAGNPPSVVLTPTTGPSISLTEILDSASNTHTLSAPHTGIATVELDLPAGPGVITAEATHMSSSWQLELVVREKFDATNGVTTYAPTSWDGTTAQFNVEVPVGRAEFQIIARF